MTTAKTKNPITRLIRSVRKRKPLPKAAGVAGGIGAAIAVVLQPDVTQAAATLLAAFGAAKAASVVVKVAAVIGAVTAMFADSAAVPRSASPEEPAP